MTERWWLRMFVFIQTIADAVTPCAGIARIQRALASVPPIRRIIRLAVVVVILATVEAMAEPTTRLFPHVIGPFSQASRSLSSKYTQEPQSRNFN